MRIYVDIDKTIFSTNGMNYDQVTPITEHIKIVNEMYENGHTITMWTARGSLSNKCFFKLTYNQLKTHGVLFHELRLGKPAFDLFIDDKAINSIWDFKSCKKISMDTSDFIIIVQARLGSTRLPEKVLLPLGNTTVLHTIIKRLQKNKFNIPVIIATSTHERDKKIRSSTCDVFRGSEEDVLQRYIDACETYSKKYIVRVCSDNPFISLEYTEKLIEDFIKLKKDYVSFAIKDKCCMKCHLGFFSEVVSLQALKDIPRRQLEKHYIENVTEYIYEKQKEKTFLIDFPIKFNENVRLTLDTKEDYDILKKLYEFINPEKDINLYQLFYHLHNNNAVLKKMEKSINKNIK